MGFITSARGCPFKCSYCSQRLLTGLTYRWHSTERIVENLDILINKYGQKQVIFYDDNFSVNKKRVVDLCDAIVASGFHKKAYFAVQTRADNLYEDILPVMKRAKFTTVCLGMETGVERLAEEIVKDETVALHVEKIKLCHKYGITISLNMIFGLPGENQEDRDYTFNLVKKLGVGFVKFNNLIPYPGTAIYEVAKKNGMLNILPEWANFNSTLSITNSIFSSTPIPYVPEGTTEFQLKRDIIRRNLQMYFSGRIVWMIMKSKSGNGFVRLPEFWFLKPGEILALIRLGLDLFSNLVFSMLPLSIGEALFSRVHKVKFMAPPADIKSTSRSFVRVPSPQVELK